MKNYSCAISIMTYCGLAIRYVVDVHGFSDLLEGWIELVEDEVATVGA